ncbi:unnamed protein product, partial [Musa acuminata subsp. burmannicoides]
RYVHLLAFSARQEPLRPELHWLCPQLLVPAHLRHREVDWGALGYQVAVEAHVLRHGVREDEVARRVPPQPLQDHRLEVRHPLQVLLPDLLRLRSRNRLDFVEQLPLHVLVFHEVRHDPLQRGSCRVGAGAQELGAEAHYLAVGELPSSFLGQAKTKN